MAEWSNDLFEQAKRQNRLVLLDLEAVWCHVMDDKTHANQEVIEFIRRHYIPVRVDQDSRPDLSNRDERYGWPATIIFGPDSTEIVKCAGYIPPGPFLSILKTVVEDPSPVLGIQVRIPNEYDQHAILTDEARKLLQKRQEDLRDDQLGGYSTRAPTRNFCNRKA